MKSHIKAKWIVGMTGAAFSAFVLGQLDDTPTNTGNNSEMISTAEISNIENNSVMAAEVNDSMSDREKELAQLDWSNFTLDQRTDYSDYTTRRS